MAHGLPLLNPERSAEGPPRFTRAPAPGARSTRTVAVRPLPPEHLTDIPSGPLAGLRLTSPARTAIDLAAEVDLPEALMLVDAIARHSAAARTASRQLRGVVSDRVLAAAVRPLVRARVVRTHWNVRASRALELADPRRESPGESLSFGYIALSGLPLPQCQAPIETDDGVKWVDFDWPEFGVSGECHGAIKYDGSLGDTEGVLVAEAARLHAVQRAGRHVVPWDVRGMLFNPYAVVDEISRRLQANGWRPE